MIIGLWWMKISSLNSKNSYLRYEVGINDQWPRQQVTKNLNHVWSLSCNISLHGLGARHLVRHLHISLLTDEFVSSTLYSVHSMNKVHCDMSNKYAAMQFDCAAVVDLESSSYWYLFVTIAKFISCVSRKIWSTSKNWKWASTDWVALKYCALFCSSCATLAHVIEHLWLCSVLFCWFTRWSVESILKAAKLRRYGCGISSMECKS